MRITDQYFWNVVFTVFFLVLAAMATIILETEAYKNFTEFTAVDYVLVSLATFRLIRLMVYDKITAFFREQFWDAKELKSGVVLSKPLRGPRRTLADLLACPWCIGIWAGATVLFFYMLTPYALFPTAFLALSAVATSLQLTVNMIGWKAEQLKNEVERQ